MADSGISRRGFISLGVGATAAGLVGGRTAKVVAGETPTALTPLAPAIIPRAYWDAPKARTAPSYGYVNAGFVHHTQMGGNEYLPEEAAAVVRKIAEFHISKRGWNDVGYNFLIDRYGQIYEGREGGIERAVIGAQAQGYNTISSGASLVGDFSVDAPPQEALDSIAKLLAWKLHSHGVAVTGTVTTTSHGGGENRFGAGKIVSLKRISGHRDGDKTDCPGAALYGLLPQVRTAIENQVRTFPKLSCAVSQGAARGRLTLADGKALSGTKVAFQKVGAAGFTTVAETTTAADGKWATPLATPLTGVVRAVGLTAEGAIGACSRQLELRLTRGAFSARRARGF